jgi:hypothetical protein
VSSLWTPEGEHEVPRADSVATAATPPPAETSQPAPTTESDPLASQEVADEMASIEAELSAAPVEEVIANHCYGLFQLAAIHLGQQPPNLASARLAIDAFGALVEGLEGRLGSAEGTLRDGLAQLRLAFVQISAAANAQANEQVADPPAT